MLLHTSWFWQKAEWDERTSEPAAQIWSLGGSEAERTRASPIDLSLHAFGGQAGGTTFTGVWIEYPQHLDCIINISRKPNRLHFLCECQLNLVGGTDGSACMQTDRINTGFALGNERIPLLQFLAPVG
jgi:hypothetical protein